MKHKFKKIVKVLLTFLQALVVIIWLVSGLSPDGFNALKFSFFPIPSIGDMFVFGLMVVFVVGVERLKEFF